MNLIFVYGTLRKCSNHPKAKHLCDHARFVGPGTIAARLYDLGPYPGIVAPEKPSDTVHGDLFEMSNPVELLGVLDEYEEAATGNRRLFTRELTKVCVANGETRAAWVYWYTGDVSKARRIESGAWSASVEA